MLSLSHLHSIFFRIRAQGHAENPDKTSIYENMDEGTTMLPLDNAEVKHAAAVIVAAFLNPGKPNYY
jgi:hypothetical protein